MRQMADIWDGSICLVWGRHLGRFYLSGLGEVKRLMLDVFRMVKASTFQFVTSGRNLIVSIACFAYGYYADRRSILINLYEK